MTAGVFDGVRSLAEQAELREQRRNGGSRRAARERLAAKIGVAPGTLFNLAAERLKKIDATLRDKLTRYAITDLEKEIRRLTHELELARALGRSEDQVSVQRLRAAVQSAQALLAETRA